ncbi:MAG: thioredoxin family protein [Bryobacterales bacterium]|jgi:thiol-disulfide isomerase/thioredoxin|nr:thioredoxin family protein [Bryobacterales bacterium]
MTLRNRCLPLCAVFLFCALSPLRAQQAGVIVLEEGDFQPTPNAAPVGASRGSASFSATPIAAGEVHVFDPRRDASADIRNALQVAARDGKHVLLDVGGNWCSYCKLLDRFYVDNPDVLALRNRHFLYVKVNFSEENQNPDALQRYGLIRGFPHYFVLDARGKLLRSQRVALLGSRTGYQPDRFRTFLRAMAPGQITARQ